MQLTFLFLMGGGGGGGNKMYFMGNAWMVNGTLVYTVNQSKQFCKTVKQSFRDTHLHWNTDNHYITDSSVCPDCKIMHFFLKLTSLMWTVVSADNRHFLLFWVTTSHIIAWNFTNIRSLSSSDSKLTFQHFQCTRRTVHSLSQFC